MLGVAYTRPYGQADTFVHVVYAATLLLSAVATALLIASVALHRTLFRHGRKGWLVKVSNRLALGGLCALLVALTRAVLLVLDAPLARWLALALAAWVLLVLLGLRVTLPAWMRGHPRDIA